jgi:HD-GYP domain-containing protein (c-di-GMP phosphodiesterase class II)
MAEGLRQDMAGLFHTINGFQIRVTISIGVSHSRGSTSTLDRLLTEADQAVYLAKAMGRNKVMMWSDGIILPDKERLVFRKTRYEPDGQTEQTFDHTLQGLLRMLYLRDYETEAHTARVSGLAMNLAKLANLPETAIEGIHHGALLHDIGKIGIPDRILFKPGKLTEAEWAIMQKHPQYAYDLIHPIPYFQHALDIPYCHHEHWDGSGYPRGLRMEEIPIAARIFSIVDVWDALSSDRPYRPAWKEEDIKRHILEQAGKMFDPTLASLFLENLDLTARNGQ